MKWALLAFFFVAAFLAIIALIWDHRQCKLRGFKRMIFYFGSVQLTEIYPRLALSLIGLGMIGLRINQRCQTENINGAGICLYFPTQNGEIAIDFPPIIPGQYPTASGPIILYKKGSVSLFERNQLIRRLSQEIGKVAP